MEKEQDYWKAETVAFLALQSIRGVGIKTLYKIAAQKISVKMPSRLREKQSKAESAASNIKVRTR